MGYVELQIREFWRDVTSLGSAAFIILTNGIMFTQDRRVGLQIVTGLILVESVGNLIKLFWHKQRPDAQSHVTRMEKIDASGFPSLHSARASMTAWILCSYWNSLLWYPFLFSLVLLVAASRILLRKHDWLDVVCGGMLGVAVAYLVVTIPGLWVSTLSKYP